MFSSFSKDSSTHLLFFSTFAEIISCLYWILMLKSLHPVEISQIPNIERPPIIFHPSCTQIIWKHLPITAWLGLVLLDNDLPILHSNWLLLLSSWNYFLNDHFPSLIFAYRFSVLCHQCSFWVIYKWSYPNVRFENFFFSCVDQM